MFPLDCHDSRRSVKIVLMSDALYFYTNMELPELEAILTGHSEWVDDFLHDLYDRVDDDDSGRELLQRLDRMADELGLMEAHPIHQDIKVEDFEFEFPEKQVAFFKTCQNCVFFQNLPDLNLNPLQVSSLSHLLENLPQVLVDDGSPESQLISGESFQKKLMEEFTPVERLESFNTPVKKESRLHVLTDDPLSLRLRSLEQAFRQKENEEVEKILAPLIQESKDLKKIYQYLSLGVFQSQDLIRKTKMNPKALSDGVERLSNFLREKV